MSNELTIKQVLAEFIARKILTERGRSWNGMTVALLTADVLDDIESLDVTDLHKLVEGYVKAGDTNVSIPTWRVKEDGTLKTEDELDKELVF